MPPQIDVLGLGSAAVDEILYVETYPSPDTKTRVLRRELRCGGLTATALVAATRLGARCAYAGRLGLDYESRLVEEYLARERVDLSQASRAAENGVVSSTIILAMDTGSRNVFSRSSGLTGAHESAPPEALIRNSRSLFVDHHGVPGAIRASRVAHDAGVPVVADLERADSPRFEELLALVNHLVVSETFARRITGCASPESAIRALWSKGRSVVILTCGATGCWYAESPPSPHFFPAFRVEARDTAGCGDVFHGAYVSSLARGRTLIERVKFASAAAALYASASREDRIPRRTEVNHFQKAFESKSLLAAKSS